MDGIGSEETDGIHPYLPNGYFGLTDAAMLTSMIGYYRPRRYVEIGSGHSTRFANRARERFATGTKITCIDPSPRVSIHRVADDVITKSVTAVEPEYFTTLAENDILFLDGSHLCFHGSDVTHFFLRVLPAVPRGVLVHLHDIFLPDEYPARYDQLHWNEQYILAAFLLCNASWRVILPVQFCHRMGLVDEGASFWMQRIA